MKTKLVCVATLLICLGGTTAEARQGPVEGGPYEIQKKKELGLFLAGGVLLGASKFLHPQHSCPCSSSDVNGFDHRFAGDSVGPHAATASDILNMGVLPSTVVLFTALDARRQDKSWEVLSHNGLILGEAALLNAGLNSLTKKLASRPRPFVYDLPAGAAELGKDDSFQSFYSGHASTSFAVSMAFARTYALSHPNGHRTLVYAAAIGLSTVTGVLRVAARKHFPTDVITGAASGIAFGLLVPSLHR